jgi:hypothetical protein
MVFDPNQKNVSPMYLGTVHNGAITYRLASMEKPPAVGQTPLVRQEVSAGAGRESGSQLLPYARVGEEGVTFAGPHSNSVFAGPVNIIFFGPRATEVEQSQEIQAALAAGAAIGQPFKLLPIASDQNWGAASTQLVHALMDQHAVAILALDRNSAHLAEQLALKAFIPVVALSSDKTLTSTNVPWIFRLPPDTTPPAALRLLQTAATRSGANPERLRDVLASGDEISGVTFLTTGEPRVQ